MKVSKAVREYIEKEVEKRIEKPAIITETRAYFDSIVTKQNEIIEKYEKELNERAKEIRKEFAVPEDIGVKFSIGGDIQTYCSKKKWTRLQKPIVTGEILL